MGDFKIGDKVEVVDIGESYEYYKKMFKELNLKKPNESNFNVLNEGITKKAHFNDIFGETKALKKEDVYVVLKGKTEEELRDLYAFLIENNEPLLCDFRINKSNEVLEFYDSKWTGSRLDEEKTRVTIEQLKQIIRPMEEETLQNKEGAYVDIRDNEQLLMHLVTNETLQGKIKRLEKELQQAKQELEESKPKVGGIAVVDNGEYKAIVVLNRHQVNIFEDAVVLPKELQEQLRPYFETDAFVLPEKWCIKDCEEVSEWASFEFDCAKFVNEGFYLVVSREFKDGYVFKKEKPTNCTEITLEQFKKYVLNK